MEELDRAAAARHERSERLAGLKRVVRTRRLPRRKTP
jgi:hypothetical protein